MDSSTMITVILSAAGGWFGLWIVNNKPLKEGITNLFLKRLNKESIKKIPLKQHKVFLQVKSYRNTISSSSFNNEAKTIFFQTYIQVLFKNMEDLLNKIVDSKDKTRPIDLQILENLNEAIDRINKEIQSTFNAPSKVEDLFNQWRTALLESLRKSIEYVVSDDIVESDYFTMYRVLDQIYGFLDYVLKTGSAQFAAMNGAFDGLRINDVIKVIPENKSGK